MTKKAEEQALDLDRIRCPDCGWHKFEEILLDVNAVSEIEFELCTGLLQPLYLEYGHTRALGEPSGHQYQCQNCSKVLATDEEEFLDWALEKARIKEPEKAKEQAQEEVWDWAVTGRILGDDRDTTLVYKGTTRAQALEEYVQGMLELDKDQSRTDEYGNERVLINSVIRGRNLDLEVWN